MESNECICFSYVQTQLENFLNNLATTLSQMTINRNAPANDSGYYQQNNLQNTTNIPSSNFFSGMNLQNVAFTVISIGVLFLLLNGSVKGKKSTKK